MRGRRRNSGPDPRTIAIGLALGRIAIGAGLWLAPQRTAQALGFDEMDGRGLVLGRIAATRDLILGAWQLRALADPDELRRVSTAIAIADAGDSLTFALALGHGERSAGIRGLAAALPASLAGAWVSRHS